MGLADRDYMKRGPEKAPVPGHVGRRRSRTKAPLPQRIKFAFWSLLRRLGLR